MASAHFVIPHNCFSLPASAHVHSAQTGGLGLLSPQCPSLFSVVSVCSSIASSAWDHLTLSFFPSIVPSEKKSEQASRKGKEFGPDQRGTWCGSHMHRIDLQERCLIKVAGFSNMVTHHQHFCYVMVGTFSQLGISCLLGTWH